MNDRELLRRYVEERSEQAFGELVRRHINLVYATALRLAGQPDLAEDVTQTVFIQLARKARSVRQVAGWLYRSACGTAKDAVRADRRRRAREAEAMKRSELDAVTDCEWRALEPLLDKALASLNDKEQNAIVLRFLEGKSLRETGQALAMTEDAAQKRVSRALEKLRAYFAGRGVTASSAVIASTLAAPAAQAAPAGLAAAVAGHSLAGASAAGTTVLGGIIETIFMTKAKATVISAIIVAAAATAVIQARKASSLRNEIIVLRGQHAEEVRRLRTQRAVAAATKVVVEQPAVSAVDIEAMIHAIARPGNWRRHREWQDFLEALKVTDIPTALAVVEKLNDPQIVRHVWRDNLLRRWARTDPAAALAYCQTMKERGERESAFSSLVGIWAENDAAGARAWVEQLSDWKLRQRALWAVASCSIQENALATVDLIERLGEWNSVPLEDVFDGWAQTDRAGAFAKAMELPSSQRSKALAAIGRSWAATDPQAALAWAETLPAGSEKDDVLGGVITRWAYTEQKAAITYLANLPAGRMRDEKLSGMVSGWAAIDAPGLLAWSQTVADSAARQKAVSAAIYGMGDKPRESVAAAESLPGEDKKTALRTAARTWAKHDPEAAQAYAPQTSDEAARMGYVTGLVEGLTESSPAAAAHLVANLPQSHEREGMVRRIVERFGSRDPAMAAAWVGSFSEDEFRNELLYEVARIWTHKDAAAAKAWVDSLPKERAWDGAFRGHARQMQMINNRASRPE